MRTHTTREAKEAYVDEHWDLLFDMDPKDADRHLKACGVYSEKTSLQDICARKLLRDTANTEDRKARFWLKYPQWSPKDWGTIALRTVQVAYPGEKVPVERPGGKPPLFTTPTATLIRILREAGIEAEMIDADQIRLVDGYLKRVRSDHLPVTQTGEEIKGDPSERSERNNMTNEQKLATLAVDLPGATNVEVRVTPGKLWINVDGVCLLRIYHVDNMVVDLPSSQMTFEKKGATGGTVTVDPRETGGKWSMENLMPGWREKATPPTPTPIPPGAVAHKNEDGMIHDTRIKSDPCLICGKEDCSHRDVL